MSTPTHAQIVAWLTRVVDETRRKQFARVDTNQIDQATADRENGLASAALETLRNAPQGRRAAILNRRAARVAAMRDPGPTIRITIECDNRIERVDIPSAVATMSDAYFRRMYLEQIERVLDLAAQRELGQ